MHVCPSLLGIHQHQPFLINPFCSSYCLSTESPLRQPPAAVMAFSHFEQLIGCKSKQSDGYVGGTGALECPLLPSISVSPGDCVLLGCVWRYEICLVPQLSNRFNHSKPVSALAVCLIFFFLSWWFVSLLEEFIPPYNNCTCCVPSKESNHLGIESGMRC